MEYGPEQNGDLQHTCVLYAYLTREKEIFYVGKALVSVLGSNGTNRIDSFINNSYFRIAREDCRPYPDIAVESENGRVTNVSIR